MQNLLYFFYFKLSLFLYKGGDSKVIADRFKVGNYIEFIGSNNLIGWIQYCNYDKQLEFLQKKIAKAS